MALLGCSRGAGSETLVSSRAPCAVAVVCLELLCSGMYTLENSNMEPQKWAFKENSSL